MARGNGAKGNGVGPAVEVAEVLVADAHHVQLAGLALNLRSGGRGRDYNGSAVVPSRGERTPIYLARRWTGRNEH